MGRSRSKSGRVSARKWREEVRGGSNYLKLPEGVASFSGKPGTYRLDFMSFVAGKGNPRAEPGEPYFERTFFVHQGIGPNQDWHLCLARTLKEKCPVCERRTQLSADPDADEGLIKALAPKERQLWLLKDLTNDPDSLLVWEVSYHLFGKQLKDKINNSDEEDGYDYFADPTDGLTMRLALQQSDKGKWTEAADIEFRARKMQYDTEVVGEMPCLDDMLVPIPYDKYKDLFLQTSNDDEGRPAKQKSRDDEDRPAKQKSRDDGDRMAKQKSRDDGDRTAKQKSRDDGDRTAKQKSRDVSAGDTVWYKGLECEVLCVSGDGTSLILEDMNGELHKAVGLDDLDTSARRTEKSEPSQDGDDWDEPEDRRRENPKKADASTDDDRDMTKTDEETEKSSKSVDGDDWDNW